MATPHDALFKQVFSQPDHARGLLRTALPAELAGRIDWRTLRPCPGSHVDDALRDRHSDLLFSIDLCGRPALLYLLLEHKSSADRFTVYQMLVYIVDIWQRRRRQEAKRKGLPPVIAVVVHHGNEPWRGPDDLVELIDVDAEVRDIITPYLPRLRVVVDDLTLQDERRLRDRAVSSLAQIAMFCLSRARRSEDLMAELRR